MSNVTNVATLAMYFALGASAAAQANDTDLEAVGGEIGLMSDLAEIAERGETHARSIDPDYTKASGVIEYEIGADYGRWYVENINKTTEYKIAELHSRIDAFYAQ